MVDIILPKEEKKIVDVSNKGNQLFYDPKIRHVNDLGVLLHELRKRSPTIKIGVANGKFRYLTPAHCAMLNVAKTQCDILVVAVNSDYSLRLNKATSKYTTQQRMFNVSSLNAVDYVVSFDEETPMLALMTLCPDYVFKGNDHEHLDVVAGPKQQVVIIKLPEMAHLTDEEKVEHTGAYKHFKI